VLNHVLCYLFNKLHKIESKRIKAVMLEYFSAQDIHETKEPFASILPDKVTKIRDKRDGERRNCRKLDDIFVIINELDEKLILSKLPIFVSDSQDKMPSNQLTEGDMQAIMKGFSEME